MAGRTTIVVVEVLASVDTSAAPTHARITQIAVEVLASYTPNEFMGFTGEIDFVT